MASQTGPIRAAYYPSWEQSSFPPNTIRPNLLTHLIYAFLSFSDNFQINVNNQGPQLQAYTNALHALNPPVRALYAVGGGADEVPLDRFARMAATPASRATFIQSTIQVARQYGFDGIDMDWEYPRTAAEMQNFGTLLEEWRAAVQREATASSRPALILTAAVRYTNTLYFEGNPAYPAASITRNLDWINVMSYDYYGTWTPDATGAHAALFDPNSNLNTDYGLGRWIAAGVPANKLVMGMPLYGRSWTLRNPNVNGIGAPATGPGPLNGSGSLKYSEVVAFNRANGARVVYDDVTVSVYSVAGTAWIGYDDVRSITRKVNYARDRGLRGYFFWQISGDDAWTLTTTASQQWR